MIMKIRGIHFLMLLFFFLNACSLLEEEKEEEQDQDVISKESIAAKWVVAGDNQPIEFVEFFEDNTYLIIANQPLKSTQADINYLGTYEILSTNILQLSDFGTMKFRMNGHNGAVIEVKLENDREYSLNVEKTEMIAGTNRTKMLCRIWKRESYGNDTFLKGFELKVLFSISGTYFASLKDPEGNRFGTLNYWKWSDETESAICVSNSFPVVCDSLEQIEIVELKNNLLKIKFQDADVEAYYPNSSLN